MYFKVFNFELLLERKTEPNMLLEVRFEVGAAPNFPREFTASSQAASWGSSG